MNEYRNIKTDLGIEEKEKGFTLSGKIFYEVLSEDLGGFRERIGKRAFAGSLNGDIRAFWNHQHESLPIGRSRAGREKNTMRLMDHDEYLSFEIDLPKHRSDIAESITREDVDGISFGFRSLKDGWTAAEKIRTVMAAELFEISPVNQACYTQNCVAVALRSMEEWEKGQPVEQRKDVKRLLELKRKALYI